MDEKPRVRSIKSLRITGQEFADYLESHSIQQICPVCQYDKEPLFHADSAEEDAHIMLTEIGWPPGRGVRPDFKVSCPNCGNSSYFDAEIVVRQVEKKRKEADNG